MKTKAAVLYKLNSPLAIEEVEVPEPEKGQVLVKIFASGICRSQLNEIKGLKGPDNYLPHLLGHEGAGIVEEAGKEVTKVKKGDFVVLSWIKGKGMNVPASRYKYGNQVINSGAIATLTQYAVVSENRLVALSKKIPAHIASLLGCAMPTGGGIVLRTLQTVTNKSVAVFGVGGVGSSTIMVLKMRGAKTIIAVDINGPKLEFAKGLGATDIVNAADGQVGQKIRRITSDGVDYAIEASGVKIAMENAYEVVKDTGTVVIAGNLAAGEKICIDPFDLIKGKKIIGSWGGETKPDIDIPYYVENYLNGNLKLDKLITRKFKLGQINKAFEMMDRGESLGRMIIEF